MRTDSATTERMCRQESGERSDEMDEKDDEIAHLTILARTASPSNCALPAIRHRQAQ